MPSLRSLLPAAAVLLGLAAGPAGAAAPAAAPSPAPAMTATAAGSAAGERAIPAGAFVDGIGVNLDPRDGRAVAALRAAGLRHLRAAAPVGPDDRGGRPCAP
jgi:polar amino acid transport system substrate-binding protein